MPKRNLKKIIITTTLIIMLITALILNLSSSSPLFKTLLVSKTFNKVLFNNHTTEETLDLAKNAVIDDEDLEYGYIVYNYLLSKNPDIVDAYTGLALIYGYLNNYKEAEHYIRLAENKITPTTSPETLVDLYYTAGNNYKASISYENYKYLNKAIEYYHKALNVSGLNQEWKNTYDNLIYLYLGGIYSTMEINKINNEKALGYFYKALETDPSDKTVYFSLASVYISLREFDKAHSYLMKYKEEFGENSNYLLAMSYYYTEIEDFNNAIHYLDVTKNIVPEIDLYKLYYYYGKYYEKTNGLEKAKESYRKAIEANINIINEGYIQETVKRLNINIDDIMEQLEKEKEENYNRRIEL